MTPEIIAKHRELVAYLIEAQRAASAAALGECLDEIERLQKLLYPSREVMSQDIAEGIWGKP